MTEPAASLPASTAAEAPVLHTARDGRGVVTLTLSDPARLNALGDGMLAALQQALDATTSFHLLFGKTCHLLIEIQHKTYWAVKQVNLNQNDGATKRLMNLNELDEQRFGCLL